VLGPCQGKGRPRSGDDLHKLGENLVVEKGKGELGHDQVGWIEKLRGSNGNGRWEVVREIKYRH